MLDSAGDVEVFQVVGSQLTESKLVGSNWQVGVIANGTFTCNPTALIEPSGTTDVFVCTGMGIEDVSQSASGGAWTTDTVASGSFGNSFTAAANGTNGLDVIYASASGIEHFAGTATGSWGGEVVTGGNYASPAAMLVQPNGTLEVFDAQTNELDHWEKSPSGPWTEEQVASIGSSAPAALFGSNDDYEVFTTTGGGLIRYERGQSATTWGAEVPEYGNWGVAPSVVDDPRNTFQAFVASGSQLIHISKPDTSGAWAEETINTVSMNGPPVAMSASDGTLQVLAQASSGDVLETHPPGGAWSSQTVPTTPTPVTTPTPDGTGSTTVGGTPAPTATTPTTTPTGTGVGTGKRKTLHVDLTVYTRPRGRRTVIRKLKLKGLPPHATISVICRPAKCVGAGTHLTAHAPRQLLLKTQFSDGEKVTITYQVTGYRPERVVLVFHAHATPTGKRLQ